MIEKKYTENDFNLLFDNIIKIYKEILSEEYNYFIIKIICIRDGANWNIVYLTLECTSNNQEKKEIIYSENNIFILYKNLILIKNFMNYFLQVDEEWSYVDNDLKFSFLYSISFDTSLETLKKKLECNCYRQKLKCLKQIHIEYYNSFGTTATGFSFNPFSEEDFVNEDRNLKKAEEVIIDFIGYKLDALCVPGIFIIFPIESFNFSIDVDLQDSVVNLSLIWRINEYYKERVMPIYKKNNQRKILDGEREELQIPYDYSGEIEVIFDTRPQFGLCTRKETLYNHVLKFPEIIIGELIKKIKTIEKNEEYIKYYNIVKNFIQINKLESEFGNKIEELKPDALLFIMSGNEYGEKTWILPQDKKKLQNKKQELIKLLESIKFTQPKILEKPIKFPLKLSFNTKYSDMDEFLSNELSEKLIKLNLPINALNDFINLLNYLVNRMVYNQNHKEFIQNVADNWFEEHQNDLKIDMETKFFQPFIRDVLKNKYGEKIFDTPNETRGHIDLKLSFTIPIELKVLRDESSNDISGIDLLETAHIKQIEGEIINNRVGFLIGLDYRKNIEPILTIMPNREYIKFIWKTYPNSQALIVLLIFSANKKSPSEL